MANSTKRLSGGKNTGVGSTFSSGRKYGTAAGGGVTSSAAPLETRKQSVATVKPQANLVDSFQIAKSVNAPGQTVIQPYPTLPQPSPDAQNLADTLSGLNSNLKGATTATLQVTEETHIQKMKDARALIEQISTYGPPQKSETIKILEKKAKEGDLAAQKMLRQYEAGASQPYIQRAIVDKQYLTNLSTAESRWEKVKTIDVAAADGTITQKSILEFPSSDPRVQTALTQAMLGDLKVSSIHANTLEKWKTLSTQIQASLLSDHDENHYEFIVTKKNAADRSRNEELLIFSPINGVAALEEIQNQIDNRYTLDAFDSGDEYAKGLPNQLIEILKSMPRETEADLRNYQIAKDKVKFIIENLMTGPALTRANEEGVINKDLLLMNTLEKKDQNKFYEDLENIENDAITKKLKIDEGKGKVLAQTILNKHYTSENIQTAAGLTAAYKSANEELKLIALEDNSISPSVIAHAQAAINTRHNQWKPNGNALRNELAVNFELQYDQAITIEDYNKVEDDIRLAMKEDPATRTVLQPLINRIQTLKRQENLNLVRSVNNIIEGKLKAFEKSFTSTTSWGGINEDAAMERNKLDQGRTIIAKKIKEIISEGRANGDSTEKIQKDLSDYAVNLNLRDVGMFQKIPPFTGTVHETPKVAIDSVLERGDRNRLLNINNYNKQSQRRKNRWRSDLGGLIRTEQVMSKTDLLKAFELYRLTGTIEDSDVRAMIIGAQIRPIEFFQHQMKKIDIDPAGMSSLWDHIPNDVKDDVNKWYRKNGYNMQTYSYRPPQKKKEISSSEWMQPQETLVAGELQPGMLPPILNIKEVPSELTGQKEASFDRTWEVDTPLEQRQTEFGNALYQAGFKDEEELTTMIAIAMAETRTRSIRNHTALNDGDESYGVLQINMLDNEATNNMGQWREKKWPWLKNRNELFDINQNAKAAYDIYKNEPWLNEGKEGLFNAWASYENGKHIEFMDQARKKAKEIILNQSKPRYEESSTIKPTSGLA